MSFATRLFLIAGPAVLALGTPAVALPAEVGRVADVFVNAVIYQNATAPVRIRSVAPQSVSSQRPVARGDITRYILSDAEYLTAAYVAEQSSDLLTEMADANPNLTIRTGENGADDTMMMLSDVLFQFGEATLAPTAEQTLKDIAGTLEDVNELIVTGHTDSIGSEENNLALGQARAEAVRDWLLQNSDLSSDIVLAKGIGEADPIAANLAPNGQDDPDGRAQNRRVEFAIR